MYTAGRNDSAGGGGHGSPPVSDAGQLGRGGSTNAFEMVPTPAGAFATQVACGRYHTAAVTAEGGVLTFGLNDRGQLGRAGSLRRPGPEEGRRLRQRRGTAPARAKKARAKIRLVRRRHGKNEPCRGGWACRDGVARFTDLGSDPVTREPRAASFVAAGRYSTVVVTKSGDVVIWGLNACGGAFDDVTENENETDAPQTVASFLDRLVNDAAFASTPRFLSRDVFFDGSAVEIAAVGTYCRRSRRRWRRSRHRFDVHAGAGYLQTHNEDGRLGRVSCRELDRRASSTNAEALTSPKRPNARR